MGRDNPLAHPLQWFAGDRVFGQFYNSYDGLLHVAEYIPYECPPTDFLCGTYGNFSPSREYREDRRICGECFAKMNAIIDRKET